MIKWIDKDGHFWENITDEIRELFNSSEYKSLKICSYEYRWYKLHNLIECVNSKEYTRWNYVYNKGSLEDRFISEENM